jgi:predicted anti-sigma-YlaC factor YlaD
MPGAARVRTVAVLSIDPSIGALVELCHKMKNSSQFDGVMNRRHAAKHTPVQTSTLVRRYFPQLAPAPKNRVVQKYVQTF